MRGKKHVMDNVVYHECSECQVLAPVYRWNGSRHFGCDPVKAVCSRENMKKALGELNKL